MNSRAIQIINADAEKTADAIMHCLKGTDANVSNLIDWVQDNIGFGIDIKHVNLDSSPACGLVYFDSNKKEFVIRVDSTDSYKRQKFTLVHELAHIIRDMEISRGYFDGELGDAQNGIERFCNRFAAAYLMPRKLFIKVWEMTDDISGPLNKILHVASRFEVSTDAVKFRALELRLLKW